MINHPFLSDARALIDNQLKKLLAQADDLPYSSLFLSARYSLFSSGKRLRPLLVLTVCESYGVDTGRALVPACALEMVHTYSLIHDDLPCMDNDDLRRGKPTLHKVYPEWHALLTGDFLLTYAFEVLSSAPHLDAEEKLALVTSLAKRAGAHGMIGGQMIDLLFEGKQMDWKLLEQMHNGKTAALFIAALEFGGILSRAPANDLETLRQAAFAIGLAFQIIDDVLDDTNCKSGKPTAVSLLGAEKAKAQAALLLQTANEHLLSLSRPAPLLSALFKQMVERQK